MKKLLKSYSKSKVALALSTAIVLVGCGGTDQDEGVISTSQQVFGGQAIDGYLARATVFIDTNNDGTRNAWEPFAFTDNDGYYSFNPLTNTNYCVDTAIEEQKLYCLVSNIDYSEAIVRIDGGYDIQTGEPFVGQLSRRLESVPDTGISNVIISPLTSLLTNAGEDDKSTVLAALNMSETDLDIDYLNIDGTETPDSRLLNTAIKLHKIVTVLSDRLTDTYTNIGEEIATPNDATSTIYHNLAEQIVNANVNFNTFLEDPTNLEQVLDNTESEIRDFYIRKDFNLPPDIGSTANPENFSRVVDVAIDISTVVDSLIEPDAVITELETLGSLRAIETVVIKSLEETNTDTTIDNAVNFLTLGDQTLVDALIESLSFNNADVATLALNDFSGDDFNSIEEITQSATLPDEATPFTQIGGLTLKVSDLDLGFAPNNLQDSEVEFYFNGLAEDIEGTFSACVKYIDEASIDGTLGDGNTRGELISGFWSLLGAETEDIQSYSLLATITFLGTTYQTILKPNGEQTIGDVTYDKIRFDFAGDFKTYHSEEGLTETISAPTTNEACLQRLPSRVGI